MIYNLKAESRGSNFSKLHSTSFLNDLFNGVILSVSVLECSI